MNPVYRETALRVCSFDHHDFSLVVEITQVFESKGDPLRKREGRLVPW